MLVCVIESSVTNISSFNEKRSRFFKKENTKNTVIVTSSTMGVKPLLLESD